MGDVEKEIERVKESIRRGMQKGILGVQRDVQLATPVVTGNLRRSISQAVTEDDNSIIGVVGSNVVYAPYVDDKRGNFTDTIHRDAPQVYEMIAEEIKKGVQG